MTALVRPISFGFALIFVYARGAGVFLTDLIFLEDGNPDTVGGLVNWTKVRRVEKA